MKTPSTSYPGAQQTAPTIAGGWEAGQNIANYPPSPLDNPLLINAILTMAFALKEGTAVIKHEADLFRAGHGLATKHDLEMMEKRIMSAISDYAARVDAKFDEVATGVDSLVASVDGLTNDVTSLKDIITKLQNNPGPISPEDQALLDAGEAKIGGIASRVSSVASALAALDAATESTPPPPPTP